MEFGRLSTKMEEMIYTLLLEQRKTNELLEKLLQTPTKQVPVLTPPPVMSSGGTKTEAKVVKDEPRNDETTRRTVRR